MDSKHYKQVALDYIRLMGAGDWQGVAKLYAADATVEDPVGSEPVRGIEAVTAFYKKNTVNPMQIELEGPVRVAGIETAFPFKVTVDFQGQKMNIHVIDVFKFNAEGKISSMKAYFGEENFVPA